jgi:hypothetical protein
MADKPPLHRDSGPLRVPSNGSSPLPTDVEVRLQSTERVKIVLQRCERTNAPHHLLVRIRETLISITTRDRSPSDRTPRSH